MTDFYNICWTKPIGEFGLNEEMTFSEKTSFLGCEDGWS
jgi:hypothetical protein